MSPLKLIQKTFTYPKALYYIPSPPPRKLEPTYVGCYEIRGSSWHEPALTTPPARPNRHKFSIVPSASVVEGIGSLPVPHSTVNEATLEHFPLRRPPKSAQNAQNTRSSGRKPAQTDQESIHQSARPRFHHLLARQSEPTDIGCYESAVAAGVSPLKLAKKAFTNPPAFVSIIHSPTNQSRLTSAATKSGSSGRKPAPTGRFKDCRLAHRLALIR